MKSRLYKIENSTFKAFREFTMQPEVLIPACVMECDFRNHMAVRDLLIHDLLAPHFEDWMRVEGTASPLPLGSQGQAAPATATHFLAHLHATLASPSHPVRQRLDRIPAASHDLLAVIQAEGRV